MSPLPLLVFSLLCVSVFVIIILVRKLRGKFAVSSRLALDKNGRVVRDKNLPNQRRQSESRRVSVSPPPIDEKLLRRLAVIVGKTIAKELLDHPDIFKPAIPFAIHAGDPSVVGDERIDSDEYLRVADIGVSLDGMEASFEDMAEEELVEGESLEGARKKLFELKSR